MMRQENKSVNSQNNKSLNMKTLLKKVFLISLIIPFLLGLNHQTLAQTRNDEVLRNAMITGICMGIPGMSIAIGYKDQLIWTGADGYSDILNKIPVKTNDMFGIGSITKTFVARVILQLAEEGKIDLNRTATDYVNLEIIKRVPNADKAKITQLINHQSGVPTWEFEADWIKDGRGSNMKLNHVWEKSETLDYITKDKVKADFKPGERYAYSNTNYTLLGLIIEAVTGNDVMTEIRNRIFKPLKLDRIYLESFEEVPDGLVHHYHYATPGFDKVAGIHPNFKGIRPYLVESTSANLSPEWVAGGMVASAATLVRWAQAVKNGELLGAEMQKEVFNFHPPKNIKNPNREYLQGISSSLNYYNGEKAFGHSGGTLGFTAMMFWLEDSDVSIVLLTNVGRMHSNVNPSPVSLFYKEVLLPAVFKYIDIK